MNNTLQQPSINHTQPHHDIKHDVKFDKEIFINGKFRGLLEKTICQRLRDYIRSKGNITIHNAHNAAHDIVDHIEEYNRMINNK